MIAEYVRRLMDFQRSADQKQAEADAAETKRLMESLTEHPGWAVLMKVLTDADHIVYNKWLGGQEVTPTEQALSRLTRLLAQGPQYLLDEARAVLTSGGQR